MVDSTADSVTFRRPEGVGLSAGPSPTFINHGDVMTLTEAVGDAACAKQHPALNLGASEAAIALNSKARKCYATVFRPPIHLKPSPHAMALGTPPIAVPYADG